MTICSDCLNSTRCVYQKDLPHRNWCSMHEFKEQEEIRKVIENDPAKLKRENRVVKVKSICQTCDLFTTCTLSLDKEKKTYCEEFK